MTGKECLYRSLDFQKPERIPLDLWILPAAVQKHGQKLLDLYNQWCIDMAAMPFQDPLNYGPEFYQKGSATDLWGCVWENKQDGIMGEVKVWPLADPAAIDSYLPPKKQLLDARKSFFRGCDDFLRTHSDKFIRGGFLSFFERMQFLRGTENLYMDIAEENDIFFKIRDMVLDVNMEYVKLACQSNIDAFVFSDDWGSQRALLISPNAWRRLFKPAYQEMFRVAQAAGKRVFFHSDGYILDIYEDFIEMGVSAINSQIWCMGADRVAAKTRGRICMWGELDRQKVMPYGTPQDVEALVQSFKTHFYQDGGVIGQFEINRDVSLENIEAGLKSWNEDRDGYGIL